MHILAEVPTWRGERIVLLGDAAHLVGAGQGASKTPSCSAACWPRPGRRRTYRTAFERKRRPRVAKMIEAAAQNRDAKTAGPIGRRVRALVMRSSSGTRSTAWLHPHDLEPLTTAGVADP